MKILFSRQAYIHVHGANKDQNDTPIYFFFMSYILNYH